MPKVFCLMFLLFFLFTGKAFAADFYVSPTGDNSNNCQSVANPCQTITEALERVVDGDVVRLAPGTYEENIRIENNILLRGANAGVALGVAPGMRSEESFIRGEGVVAASGVVLDGISFLRPDASPETISKLLQSETSGPISILNTSFNIGLAPSYSDPACGSAIFGGADWQIFDTTFQNQVYEKDNACPFPRETSQMIYLQSGSLELKRSRFSDVERSVYLKDTLPSVVEGNHFLGSFTGGVYAGSDDLLIKGNTFDGYGGILLEDASGVVIENNLFSESNTVALYVLGGFTATIKANAFLGGAFPVRTIIDSSDAGSLDLLGNFWGTDNYSVILEKIFSTRGSALADVWIQDYDLARISDPGFYPRVKSYSWEVDPARGGSRNIGQFFTRQSLFLSFSDVINTGKITVEAYDEGDLISDPYPEVLGDFYLGDPATFYSITTPSSFAAEKTQVCLLGVAPSFPIFAAPSFYQFKTSWQKEEAILENNSLCADTSAPASFLAANDGVVPTNTSPPKIAGRVQIKKRVTANPGSWQAFPGDLQYSYQWQRGKSASGPFENIAGEIGSSYRLGDRDVARFLRLRVKARNGKGEAFSFSAPSLVKKSGKFALRLKRRKKNVTVKANGKALIATLSCIEGYCQTKKRSAYIYLDRRWRKVPVFSREGELLPGEKRNIYINLRRFYKKITRNKVQLNLRALSTNGDRLKGRVSLFVRK
jgi:nitrous oxidase accessory protein NosD